MQIITGKLAKAQKVVAYGPEGVGKSTLASKFPNPVFIDIEDSTTGMNVNRSPKPLSWTALLQLLDELISDPQGFKTCVVDTIDYAERLCIRYVCETLNISALGNNMEGKRDYGVSYGKLREEFGRFLDKLSNLIDKQNIHIVLIAHHKIYKFEQPDEIGAYDRYQLKLFSGCAELVKEWADLMLFCNYKTMVSEIGGKKKGSGQQRTIFTEHRACWDAKNRLHLPEELPMSEYNIIISALPDIGGDIQNIKSAPLPVQQSSSSEGAHAKPHEDDDIDEEREAIQDVEKETEQMNAAKNTPTPPANQTQQQIDPELQQLMTMDSISEADIQMAVAHRNYRPADMPVADYDHDFVHGHLIAKWNGMKKLISKLKGN